MRHSKKRNTNRMPEQSFICDFSGASFPKSQMRKMWNGLIVHKKYWEPRHPNDFPVKPRSIKNSGEERPRQEGRLATQADYDRILGN